MFTSLLAMRLRSLRVPTPGSLRRVLGRQRGVTFIELLVVMAVMMIIAALLVNNMAVQIPIFRLRSSATMGAQVIAKARLTAIQRGVTTVVVADYDENAIYAYGEVNGDPNDPITSPQYLVFDPANGSPIGATDYTDDFLIARIGLERSVKFKGPSDPERGADATDGLTPVPSAGPGDPPVLVFSEAGIVQDVGAFRLSDGREANILEIFVGTVAGQVTIRKHLEAANSPTNADGFFAEGNKRKVDGSPGENIWVWK